ncbi:MAG: molecular chaperone SurA, partial [Comamonadaceae bacterium]
MNHRVIALAIATLASLTSEGALAQGLRPSGAPAGTGLTARPPATPSITLPAPDAGGGASSGSRQADFIVAVVNSEPVTNNEVRSRLARAEAQLAQQGGAVPPRDVLAREVLERIILERVQLQQAKESGVKVDDFAIGQAEQGVARQNNMTVEE